MFPTLAGMNAGGVIAGFNDAIDDLAAGKLGGRYVFKLGRPLKILLDAGVPDLPTKMFQSVVKKATCLDGQGKHDLSLELLYNLPRHINNLVAVFDSALLTGAKTLILQFRHQGKPVMAALYLREKLGNLEIDRIASVYERSEREYVNWVQQKKLRSLDKQKGQWLLALLRAAIAPGASGSLIPNKILCHAAEPVKSGVREDVDGANVRFFLRDSAEWIDERGTVEKMMDLLNSLDCSWLRPVRMSNFDC